MRRTLLAVGFAVLASMMLAPTLNCTLQPCSRVILQAGFSVGAADAA
jgi:hypothetical protein